MNTNRFNDVVSFVIIALVAMVLLCGFGYISFVPAATENDNRVQPAMASNVGDEDHITYLERELANALAQNAELQIENDQLRASRREVVDRMLDLGNQAAFWKGEAQSALSKLRVCVAPSTSTFDKDRSLMFLKGLGTQSQNYTETVVINGVKYIYVVENNTVYITNETTKEVIIVKEVVVDNGKQAANCGVAHLDGDTPGCPNGRNDGSAPQQGHPGAQGGNGNNTAVIRP